jgi:hypothetical protein
MPDPGIFEHIPCRPGAYLSVGRDTTESWLPCLHIHPLCLLQEWQFRHCANAEFTLTVSGSESEVGYSVEQEFS